MPEQEKSVNEAPTSSQPIINIYSDNVNVTYTTTQDGGYKIDIKDEEQVEAPKKAEIPLVAQNVPTQNAENSNKTEPNWVDYATLILLALLLFEGLGERLVKRFRK